MGQQFLDLEGTKILANKIKEGERKVAMVGSDNTDSNGWYKVARQTCSGFGDTNITFMVTSTYGNYNFGQLQLQIRSDDTSISCKRLSWITRTGLDPNHYIVLINGMTWTLYAYQPSSRYGRICFEILSMSNINGKDMSWTLDFKNNNTKESTTPNATVKSSDGATVNHANTTSKLQTARTINGVSFDGSSNISINSMTTGSNITLFADSDSSSTTEYASIKAGGNELKITSSGGGSSPVKNNNNLTFNGNVVYHTGKKPTPSEIGASPSNHNHDDRYYTESEIDGKLNSKLNTSGGTMTGALNLANNTWNKAGDDVFFGDKDVAGHFCIKAVNASANTGIALFPQNGNFVQTMTTNGNGELTINGNIRGELIGASSLLRTRYTVPSETGSQMPAVGAGTLSFSEAYNNGFPYNYGNVITAVGASATGCSQLFMGWTGVQDGLEAPLYYRNKRDNENALWSEWSRIATTSTTKLTPLNGWGKFYLQPRISKSGNIVTFSGRIRGGITTINTVVFEGIPEKYRPEQGIYFPVYNPNGSFLGAFSVLESGEVRIQKALSSNEDVCINISFSIL